jgi:hypothetical protein
MLHKTADGRLIPIVSLNDDHLINIIKFPFKKFQHEDNKLLSFMLGKDFEKLTPEKFNKIISENCFFVLEGLRRQSTRQKVIHLLSLHNEIWKSDEKIDVPAELNFLKLSSSNEDNNEDEYDVYDIDGHHNEYY